MCGTLASVLIGRSLSSLLFGVSTLDFVTLFTAVSVHGAVTTLAALIPAWRSSRTEPMIALRSEELQRDRTAGPKKTSALAEIQQPPPGPPARH